MQVPAEDSGLQFVPCVEGQKVLVVNTRAFKTMPITDAEGNHFLVIWGMGPDGRTCVPPVRHHMKEPDPGTYQQFTF